MILAVIAALLVGLIIGLTLNTMALKFWHNMAQVNAQALLDLRPYIEFQIHLTRQLEHAQALAESFGPEEAVKFLVMEMETWPGWDDPAEPHE